MASPIHSPHQNSSTVADWTLAEKIRLLELYSDRDMLWDQRCEVLQLEFAKRRSPDFFNLPNARLELHRIFSKPNPEHHICGMPVHPRGKEAAELWLKHFRKEYAEFVERKKQMFAVAIRRHMDLIHRYQQGKVTAEEMEAILTEQRQKDAQRADSEIYEAKIKEAIDKLDPDGLKNIRSTADYVNYVRGDRIPTPPPVQSKFDQQIPTLASPTRSFASPEPVLKDIQNSTTKEDELPSIDIIGATETQINQKPEEKMEENKLEEIDVHFKLQNRKSDNELCVQKILAHSERAFAELATHESILSKTSCQNSEFSKQNNEEATQIVFDVQNTKESIEMTIQMPLVVTKQREIQIPKAKSPIKTTTSIAISSNVSPPTFTISPANKEKDEEEKEKEITFSGIVVPRKRIRVQHSIMVDNPPLTRGREKRQSTSGTTEGESATDMKSTIARMSQKQWAQGRQEVQEASTNMQAEMGSTTTRERRTSLRKDATPKQQKEEEKALVKEEGMTETAVNVLPKSKKKKRGELDLLTTAASGVEIPAENSLEAGPPSKNLRRSSHQLSPLPLSTATTLSASPSTTSIPTTTIPPVQSPKPEPMVVEESPPIVPPFVIPEELQEPPILSRIAINTKLRSSLRRAALATSTPSPAVDSIGENALFLRPGNHTSDEIIPPKRLLTLWNDIRAHRYTYIFDQPVSEEEVPGYHSAIKKPMDLKTLKTRIESGAVQTFGQFSDHIFLMFANACMYNSTGHHVNSYAKEMLAYALKCIQVVQYPYGMWAQTHPLCMGATGGVGGGTGSRQSNASGSDVGDGRISRSSTTTTSTNATKSTSQSTATAQRMNRRSASGMNNSGIGGELGGRIEQRKTLSASIKQEMQQQDDLKQSTSSSPTKANITQSGSEMELDEEGTMAANISAIKRRTSQRKTLNSKRIKTLN